MAASPRRSCQDQASQSPRTTKRLRNNDDDNNLYPGVLELYQVAHREMSSFPDVPLPPSLEPSLEPSLDASPLSDQDKPTKKRKLREKPVRTNAAQNPTVEVCRVSGEESPEKEESKRVSLAYDKGYASGMKTPSKLFELITLAERPDLAQYLRLTPSLGSLKTATVRQREATMEMFQDVRDQTLGHLTGIVNGAFDKIIREME